MAEAKNEAGVILFCAVILSLLVYGFVDQVKLMPTGDETIAYLCATGNQELYERVNKHEALYGKMSKQEDWQQFFNIEQGAFGRIAPDLAKTDLHPPLYFWILHVVLHYIQPMFKAGLLLNLLCHLAIIFVLYKLGITIGLSRKSAAIVVLFWCLSPAIISIGFVARQYQLLCLLNICAALAFAKYEQNKQPVWAVLFLLSLTAGALTHYLYLYFMLGYLAYAIVYKKHAHTWFITLAAITTAIIVLLVLHPGVLHQFMLQQTRAQQFHLTEIPLRIGKVLISFIQLVLPVMALKTFLLKLPLWAVVGGIVSLSAGLLLLFKNRSNKQVSWKSVLMGNKLVTWLLLCSLVLAIVPYLLFFTPQHAMGGQYLVLVYPFLFLTVLPQLIAENKLRSGLIIAFFTGLFLQLTWLRLDQKRYAPLFNDIKNADAICVNSTDRRGFLRVLPYLKAGQVIVMDEKIAPCGLPYPNTLFISDQSTKDNAGAYFKQAKAYDLNDGVVFYTQMVNPVFCEQLHEK